MSYFYLFTVVTRCLSSEYAEFWPFDKIVCTLRYSDLRDHHYQATDVRSGLPRRRWKKEWSR
jgi:hypothetical protein